MKKIILLVFSLFASSIYSQISVTKLDNTPINHNDIISYSSTEENLATLGFLVHNLGSTSTDVYIRCESITNATGANFQLCFGDECLPSVAPGGIYPNRAVNIAPGGTNGQWDHFWNSDTGNGSFPMDYVFTFFQVDSNGNPTSNSVTFTYRYNPSLYNPNFEKNSFVTIKNTTINSIFSFSVTKNTQMKIYDVTGKNVIFNELEVGSHNLDFSNLNTGIYIVHFSDKNGNILVRKILKK